MPTVTGCDVLFLTEDSSLSHNVYSALVTKQLLLDGSVLYSTCRSMLNQLSITNYACRTINHHQTCLELHGCSTTHCAERVDTTATSSDHRSTPDRCIDAK